MSVDVLQLTPDDVALFKALLATFGEAFDDVATYSENRIRSLVRRRPGAHHGCG